MDSWALTVELDEDGAVIVSDEVFCQYGRGATLEAALSAYAYALFAYWAAAKDVGDTPLEMKIVEFLQPFVLGKESEGSNE